MSNTAFHRSAATLVTTKMEPKRGSRLDCCPLHPLQTTFLSKEGSVFGCRGMQFVPQRSKAKVGSYQALPALAYILAAAKHSNMVAVGEWSYVAPHPASLRVGTHLKRSPRQLGILETFTRGSKHMKNYLCCLEYRNRSYFGLYATSG